jgi:hypothetical protein
MGGTRGDFAMQSLTYGGLVHLMFRLLSLVSEP